MSLLRAVVCLEQSRTQGPRTAPPSWEPSHALIRLSNKQVSHESFSTVHPQIPPQSVSQWANYATAQVPVNQVLALGPVKVCDLAWY